MSSGFTNGEDFDRQLTKFARKILVAPEKAVKKVAFSLFRRIVEETPVDTGRARASWNMSIGSINTHFPPEGRYTDRGSQIGASGSAGAQANAVLAGYGADGRLPVIWISNNLPYIGELENGHSDQAPVGMLALAIDAERVEFDAAWREAMSS